MRFETIDPSDVRYRWAMKTLTGKDSSQELPGQDVPSLSMWCHRVEESSFHVTATDWIAYQVLRGDEATWQSATKMANRGVLHSVGEQIRCFSLHFIDLTKEEKKRHFNLLEAQSIGNSFASQAIERFRPFLDLPALDSFRESPDVLELIRNLIYENTSGPIQRKEYIRKILRLCEAEPKRWSVAAKQLRDRHPGLTKLDPLFVDRLLYFKSECPKLVAERKAFKRRHAFRLLRCRLVEQLSWQINPIHIIAASFGLFFVFAIIGAANRSPIQPKSPVTFAPSYVIPKPLSNTKNPTQIWGRSEEEQKEIAKLLKLLNPKQQTKEAVNLLPTAEQAAIHEELKKEWKKTALLQGSQGLDTIEEKLKLDSENQTIPPDALTHGLRLFRYWRSDVGNAIASKVDKRRQNQNPSATESELNQNEANSEIEARPSE